MALPPSALSIGQPEPPTTELLLEDPILLAEILNDRILLTGNPAGQGGDEDLPRLEDSGHPSIVARQRSIRQLSRTVQIELFFPGFCSAE